MDQKVKSFEQYVKQVRTEKLLQKAYMDHLLQQLAEAKQIPVKDDKVVMEALNELKEMVIPVSKFFSTPVATPISTEKKRVSRKEKLRLEKENESRELQAHRERLENESLNRVLKAAKGEN